VAEYKISRAIGTLAGGGGVFLVGDSALEIHRAAAGLTPLFVVGCLGMTLLFLAGKLLGDKP
jgi:hypothetical protein